MRLLAWIALATRLAAQPPSPDADALVRLRSSEFTSRAVHPDSVTAAAAPLSVTLTSRAQSRAFYNAVYTASQGIASGWTGSLSGAPGASATGSAGTLSAAYQTATQLRINWYRAMCGVPAAVGFDSVESAMDQQSALMMAANNALSHTPPPNWLLYTSDAATAAANSNLALGNNGPDAINAYMADAGANNSAVGHRRWLLYPQTQTMASGGTDATGLFLASNATWIVDSNFGTQRPATRDNYVAWPAPGYVPYQMIFPRWSFTYPNADFSAATVTMTSNGVSIPAVIETPIAAGYGENTLVWDYNGLDPNAVTTSAPQPSSDVTYTVQVKGVSIGGVLQNFTYSVTEFDPAVAGPDETPLAVSGAATASLGQPGAYSVSGLPSFASGFEYRGLSLSAFSTVFGAEGGLQGVVAATSSGYSTVDTSLPASGTASYHLAMPDFTTQTLTLPGSYVFPSGTATLSFASRLGYAGTGQVAHVQISLNDGLTWSDLYTQAGTSGAGEAAFTSRSISLNAFAGLTFMVRFAYIYTSGLAYTQTSTGVGWNIDSITLTGVQSATIGSPSAQITGSGFTYAPSAGSAVGIQARAVLFNNYPNSWGPVFFQTVVPSGLPPAPVFSAQPTAQTVASGSTVVFQASASPATGFQWYLNGSPIASATSQTLVVSKATAANAGTYTCVALNGSTLATSAAAVLSISTTTNVGRLINLSVNTTAGKTQILTVGFVTGGAGTSGQQSLLIRATGPALAALGVSGTLADPTFSIFNSSGLVAASNDNWGFSSSNQAAVTAADTAVFAFPLTNPSSLDAALVTPLAAGAYTVQVSGNTAASGVALAEVYDDTPAGSYTAATPRLVNLSCNTQIAPGGTLTAGFVVGGSTSKTVLIRATGPALAALGVSGTIPDPEITLYTGSTALVSNAGWGGDPQITAVSNSVFAFALTNPASKDSVVLATLAPGTYTAAATSVSGAAGVVLIEVYEVP